MVVDAGINMLISEIGIDTNEDDLIDIYEVDSMIERNHLTP